MSSLLVLAKLSPAEISGLLAGSAAFLGSIVAFIKFGLGERGTLTITQAQGANTILDAALRSLNAELERKDKAIDELQEEKDSLRRERDSLLSQIDALQAQITRGPRST